MLHMSLDMTNCVLYFEHNAAESTLQVQRERVKERLRIKKVKPFFWHRVSWVCEEQQSAHVSHQAGAWAGIKALHLEIGFTEVLVLPVLATMLKGMGSICATSWVDLSFLASLSFGQWLWWREPNTSSHFRVCFCITWFASVKLLSDSPHTTAEVFENLLLSNNGGRQVKFIYKVCLSESVRLLSRTNMKQQIQTRKQY